MSDAKKGKAWLAEKLNGNGASRLLHEPQTQRFTLRGFNARLVQPPGTRTDAGVIADGIAATRHELRADWLVHILSLRVQLKDRRQKGKLCETWIRSALLRRLIELPKPTRRDSRIGCERYSIAIGYLQHHGLCEPDSRNGFVWTSEFKHLSTRAGWLVRITREQGELRNVGRGGRRYEFTD